MSQTMLMHSRNVTVVVRAFIALFILVSGVRADPIDSHVAHEQLQAIFAANPPGDFKPTGVTRADYLKLIAANVDCFVTCQDANGAIIDPVSKGERQYSTPAYAFASALLVKDGKRTDLLESSTRAMSWSLSALINGKSADGHADFYIPMLVHAYRLLKDVAPHAEVEKWEKQFKFINPRTVYRGDLRAMNWNLVSCSGEFLRRHDGLVAADQLDSQAAYLEQCLAGHMKSLTPLGLCDDPGEPMAYDAFSRLWLEDAFADNACTTSQSGDIRNFLRAGGLSTLLMLSPTGEWPTGGRSAQHNWTDAQCAAICEINAEYWHKERRDDVAGSFKRAAHLALQSVARWERPGGDIWIVKNRAEPKTRLGYESYSNPSQYNLLPMAMFAIAYLRADESIPERPSVAETGGYVFDARQPFHKIAAAAAGYYILIDTAADPHYNATGLQRVHKAGVAFPTLSDSTAGKRVYEPLDSAKLAITPAIQWRSGKSDAKWSGLSDYEGGKGTVTVSKTDLEIKLVGSQRVIFNVVYTLSGDGATQRRVSERYSIAADGVTCESAVVGSEPDSQWRVQFPVLVSDGANDLDVKLSNNSLTTTERGCSTRVEITSANLTGDIAVAGPRIVSRNGYIQQAVVGIRDGSASWHISLAGEMQK